MAGVDAVAVVGAVMLVIGADVFVLRVDIEGVVAEAFEGLEFGVVGGAPVGGVEQLFAAQFVAQVTAHPGVEVALEFGEELRGVAQAVVVGAGFRLQGEVVNR